MKLLFKITFLFFLPCEIHAQVLTLDSVLNFVTNNNPGLRIYDARIKAASAYAAGAKSYEPPQVGAGLFMTPYNPMMWQADEMEGSPGMGSFMLSAQQMFMNRQKLKANADVMLGMGNVDRQMQGTMRNEMFAMAKMSYYMSAILIKKLAVFDESERLLEYIVKSAELRYSYGMDKLNAYYKSQAMLSDIKTMRLMVEFEITKQKITLNTLMNRDLLSDFEIDTILVIKNYENAFIDTTLITSKKSEYKAVSANINLLLARQDLERAKLKPDFGIKYDHMIAFGQQPQQFSLMAMLTIPIAPWSSKMYRSSITGLGFEIDALYFQQQSIINDISGSLNSYMAQIKSKKQQLELYRLEIIPSMKKNYETSLLAFEQNKEELFMTLDAWQNLKLVQLSYLDMLNELLQLQVNYEKELEIR